MKWLLSVLLFCFLSLGVSVHGDDAKKVPVVAPAVVAAPAATVVVPTPVAAQNVVEVEPPATWVVDALKVVQGLPIVGPIVSKVLQWAAVIGTIISALVMFLLISIRALGSVLNLGGLVSAAAALEAFKTGKVMYWLKYFSFFNAKKDEGAKV